MSNRDRSKQNIFVTGFSGTGKSTVSLNVATTLGWQFIDMDQEITQQTGTSIETIFREEGESIFRNLEKEILQRICMLEHQVVSTGGGVGIDKRNLNLMSHNGFIVCLEATPQTIHRRLIAQFASRGERVIRPLLSGKDPLQRIVNLKNERQQSYLLADWTVHTDGMTPDEVGRKVVDGWEFYQQPETPEVLM